MNFHTSNNELDEIRELFHHWKQNNPNRHVPKSCWNDVFKLIPRHGLRDVAKAIGYAPSELLRRQKNSPAANTSKMQFVEIQPCQQSFTSSQIKMNIRNNNGVVVELSFQGDVEKVFPLISSMFKEEI